MTRTATARSGVMRPAPRCGGPPRATPRPSGRHRDRAAGQFRPPGVPHLSAGVALARPRADAIDERGRRDARPAPPAQGRLRSSGSAPSSTERSTVTRSAATGRPSSPARAWRSPRSRSSSASRPRGRIPLRSRRSATRAQNESARPGHGRSSAHTGTSVRRCPSQRKCISATPGVDESRMAS